MSSTGHGSQFPSTNWRLIEEAAHASSSPDALRDVIKSYQRPIYAYLTKSKRLSPQEAEELTQSFLVSKLLESDLLTRADCERGRFRALLLTALERFLIDEHRRRSTALRHELSKAADPGGTVEPTVDVFDIEWARGMLEQTIALMRSELEQSGRPELWELFEVRVLSPALHGTEPPSYAALCKRFGFQTPTQACSAVVTAKRMFARTLRQVVSRYERSEEGIESEIGDLKRILGQPRAG